MSRNTEYQFISTDTEALKAQMTAMYEEITGISVQPASPENQFIRWVTSIILQERIQNNYTGNQNIPSRAVGDSLDALGELFYLTERPAAKAAKCMERFYISEAQKNPVSIPKGTRVTDTGRSLVWETMEDAEIPPGSICTDVEIACQTPGAVGNGYVAGQLRTLVDLYDYYDRCENIEESNGGADKATDDEYYELLRASMDGYSCAGAQGGYIYFAKQVSTKIADVVANSPEPGIVKIYVLMDDGSIANDAIRNEVLAACNADEVRPLTDQVFVEDAETVSYDVEFTYYTQTGNSQSAADVRAAVDNAVAQYNSWQCAKLGRDINPSYLHGLLMQTGIKRIEPVAPAFTVLRDGSDKTVPQIAKLGTVTVTNGGYEDE